MVVRTESTSQTVARRLCVIYLVLLVTGIMFIGNPLKYVRDPWFAQGYRLVEPGLHVVLFAVLGSSVCAARWPVHPSIQFAVLIVLAASTELVQLGIGNRTARITCFIQDVFGLMIGGAVWSLLRFGNRRIKNG